MNWYNSRWGFRGALYLMLVYIFNTILKVYICKNKVHPMYPNKDINCGVSWVSRDSRDIQKERGEKERKGGDIKNEARKRIVEKLPT